VILLQDLDFFTGEAKLREAVLARENVKGITGVAIRELLTENGELRGVVAEKKANGEKFTVECDGLFVAIGLIPENENFRDVAPLNDYGYIDAGEDCLTGRPGIYTAGDCRAKSVRQITTAVADGAVAALAACRYLDTL
jgi:thioredoxin reductase (NADPH)